MKSIKEWIKTIYTYEPLEDNNFICMHTSFDSLYEIKLTYCTRVLPYKRCGKI